MKIEQIKLKLETILKAHNLTIFSIRPKKEFGEHILEILLDGSNIDTEILETIHQSLVDKLDEGDLEDHYYLEISSVGIERPIRSLEELKGYLGHYIYFESDEYRGNATLLEIEDDVCLVSVNIKGSIKKMKIKYEKLNGLRLAVKV